MSGDPRTLVDLLRLRAEEKCDTPAYTFLMDGEREGPRLTYGEIDIRARTIAATLQAAGLKLGDRALLLYPPCLDFIPAFFGCLYAGVIAVPSYPPQPAQLARTLPRLLGILADAEVSVILAPSSVVDAASSMRRHAPALDATPWLASDTLGTTGANDWCPPVLDRDHLAFLQYTSGSTAEPKGVMVSHANLLHNLAYASHAAEND